MTIKLDNQWFWSKRSFNSPDKYLLSFPFLVRWSHNFPWRLLSFTPLGTIKFSLFPLISRPPRVYQEPSQMDLVCKRESIIFYTVHRWPPLNSVVFFLSQNASFWIWVFSFQGWQLISWGSSIFLQISFSSTLSLRVKHVSLLLTTSSDREFTIHSILYTSVWKPIFEFSVDLDGYRWPPTISNWLKIVFWQFW